MVLQKVWLCTSKNSKLHRIYFLNTGNTERTQILNLFQEDLNRKIKVENEMEKLNRNSLIEDIPYYIDFDEIDKEDYFHMFKEKVEELLEDNPPRVIQFYKNPLKMSEISNFEENEGIKFIIAQTDEDLYFLHAPTNSIIKNKLIMSISITDNASVFSVPRGIQIPSVVAARLNLKDKRLCVYDVNRFESMLTLNENQKAKSKAVLNSFSKGEYKISLEEYTFSGLDLEEVKNKLFVSKRAIRRLSKYKPSEKDYSISKIKEAVNKLAPELRVTFDDDEKIINVSPATAKTFVGIIHNVIVERLISGEVEIVI